MRLQVLTCAFALVVLAALPAASDTGVADEAQEVCVWVADPEIDIAEVKGACALQLGVASLKSETLLGQGAHQRGRLLTYSVKGSDRDCRQRARLLSAIRNVTEVFVNASARTKGAPSQIPVIEGDLEPRAIREQFAMTQIRASDATLRGTGSGIVVAVLDGGFDLRHEALAGRIHPAKFDFLDNDADPQDLGNGIDEDDVNGADSVNGHGTFAASLILAEAPDAVILPIRVLDDEGWGKPAQIAQALSYAASHRAQVVNMSLVIPDVSTAMRDAVKALVDAGIVVVSSAGNEKSWQNDPQLSRRVITVGASNPDGTMAEFSGTGSHVHVYAPGVRVLGAYGGASGNDYAWWQGTSFSAPMVSGLTAIVRERKLTLPVEQIRDGIMETVDVMSDVEPAGRGRMHMGRASSVLLGQ